MSQDLATLAKERGIRYFLISYTDLFGSQRAKLVPAAAIADMQKDGAGFAGFATWLDLTPAHLDLFAMPDPSAVFQLPWKKDVAWVAADLVMDDKPVSQAPRVVLKNIMAEAAKDGLYVKTGVECEFFLTKPCGTLISDESDTSSKACYDQQALMRRYDVISEICDHMLELGWGPYQNDHEDANGQWEMNWNFDDSLVTADRHAFFKFMAKAVAEKHGFRATFMPKPFLGLTGTGCHAHISVWDKSGKTNMFYDADDDMGYRPAAIIFSAGLCDTLRRYRRSPIQPSIAISASMPRKPCLARRGRRTSSRGRAITARTWFACPAKGALNCACRTAPRTRICFRPSSSPLVSAVFARKPIRASVSISICIRTAIPSKMRRACH